MSFAIHSAELSESLLNHAFPFHLIADKNGRIISYGESLCKTVESIAGSDDCLFDHFKFDHPATVTGPDQLPKLDRKLLILSSKAVPDLLLRGQLFVDNSSEAYVFLISPWVTDLDALEGLGLSLTDFPTHSPVSDFLILLQAQRVSLEESMRLSDELSQLNKELEDRVVRRTAALERKAAELSNSKNILEHEMQERQRVEIELRHAQKMESVGQLAAGVAHEINTPMQYVGSSLRFLHDSFTDLTAIKDIMEDFLDNEAYRQDARVISLKEDLENVDFSYLCERSPKALARAMEGIARVSDIVRAMNEFTHPDRSDMESADINRALETVLTIAKHRYKYVARIEKNFDDLPVINCHLSDLNQVFLNLIVNAADAIEDKQEGEGVIAISTKCIDNRIFIQISDNGTGIPTDVQHRVFDPFFTTKEVGKGTGQGLSISHKIIVDKHRGSLSFETQPDKGTTFYIELPLAAQPNDSFSDQKDKVDNKAA